MADYWFFLSYARLELDVYIKRFREDVAARLRGRAGIEEARNDRIGFLDVDGIEHGTDWPTELAAALHSSRVLIPLYSPLYFKREYCGKEFQVFRHPSDAYKSTSASANLPSRPILPVLLHPVAKAQLPRNPEVASLQYTHGSYPALYTTKGLFYLMDTPGYEKEYKEFLAAFIERLVSVAQAVQANNRLAASRLKRPQAITAAFPVTAAHGKAASSVSAAHPAEPTTDLRSARFICIAPKRGEVRRKVDAYGDTGGIDWKPFTPEDNKIIGEIAQEAALQERFISSLGVVDKKLKRRLEDAERERSVVVVLLDPWSLTLQSYRQLVSPCDTLRTNCAVIVPWLGKETAKNKAILEVELHKSLPKVSVAIRHPVYFRDTATTPNQLRSEIRSTLTEVHLRMLGAKAAELGRTAGPPPAVSNGPGGGMPNA